MGMDEAGAQRTAEAVPHGLVHAVRGRRFGDEVRARPRVRELSSPARRRVSADGPRKGRVVWGVVRRVHRASICGALAGAGDGPDPGILTLTRLGANRAPAAVPVA